MKYEPLIRSRTLEACNSNNFSRDELVDYLYAEYGYPRCQSLVAIIQLESEDKLKEAMTCL